MNWNALATFTKEVWSVVGPLIGVLIGAYIANRNQRRNWIADHKRVEYQTLLSIMTEASGELLQLQNRNALTMEELNKAQVKVYNAINLCVFTSDTVMMKLDVFGTWAKATEKLKGGDKAEFSNSTALLLEHIRHVALKDINS